MSFTGATLVIMRFFGKAGSTSPFCTPSENEAPTPQELRQFLLSTLETSQQALVDLSDEDLEVLVGGSGCLLCSAKESPEGGVYVGK